MIENKSYFVGIGVAKAGTTWLYDYLLQHPQACVCAMKELHYFDARYIPELATPYVGFANELTRLAKQLGTANHEAAVHRLRLIAKRLDMDADPEAYRDYFRALVRNEHKVFGEITPSYSMLGPDGFRCILKLFPKAKFILILRNPVDRFWSQLRFAQKIHAGFKPERQYLAKLTDPQFAERGNYRKTLTSLEVAGVASEQLYTTFFEDLFGPQGEEELLRLTAFLDIDYRQADFATVRNESPQAKLPKKVRCEMIAQMRDSYQAVAERFAVLPASWQRDLEQISRA